MSGVSYLEELATAPQRLSRGGAALLRNWLARLQPPQAPLPVEAAPWLDRLLTRGARVFEFGAGDSTLYFARRAGDLVTVEHDPVRLARISRKMRWRRKVRWQSSLQEPVALSKPALRPVTDPLAYATCNPKYTGRSFRLYATTLDRYPDNSFDVILLGGEARAACFRHAVAKVKPGGRIILNNAEREDCAGIQLAATKLGFEIQAIDDKSPHKGAFGRTLIMTRTKDHFALFNLDVKLEQYIDFDAGFFIEVGANDGVSQSNTLYFERRRGWRGLLIEPIPELAAQCRRLRPLCRVEQAALVSPTHPGQVTIRFANLMSTVKGAMKSSAEEDEHIALGERIQKIDSYELEAPAATLSSLLDKHDIHAIDLLSLDIEGGEAQALRGLDLSRHRPRFILVEARYRDDIHSLLSGQYDLIAELSCHDLLYRLRGDQPRRQCQTRSGSGNLLLMSPERPMVFLVNQISRHGHLDLYARLYSACLLELGYRVVLIAEHESGICRWIADNYRQRKNDFMFFCRSELRPVANGAQPPEGDSSAAVPGTANDKYFGSPPHLSVRIRLIWAEEGVPGILLRVRQNLEKYYYRVIRRFIINPVSWSIRMAVSWSIRFFLATKARCRGIERWWSPPRGVNLRYLVDEIEFAKERVDTRPDLVLFLYLDMIDEDWRGCRALANRLHAPWAGILFDPRCTEEDGARPERFFRCRNARGAAFLNPHSIAPYRRRFPALRFGQVPDVTDASVLQNDPPLVSRLRAAAAGRQIVLQFGSLTPHKGVMRLIDVIRRADPQVFFFAIVGEIFWESYGKDQGALRSFVEAPPENCLVHPAYIEDERELNSIIAAADILYAVYDDFRPSSNTLTKAAIFNKPVMVRDRHLMGERVRQYRTGAAVASGTTEEVIAALETLRRSDRSEFGFAAYRKDHSVEALKKELAGMLEVWLQPHESAA